MSPVSLGLLGALLSARPSDIPSKRYRATLDFFTNSRQKGQADKLDPYSLRIGKLGLLLAMSVGGLITWALISRQRAQQEQEERARKAQRQREDTTISSLADRYNAVINWRQPFNDDRFVSKIYSAELTPLLVRLDGRDPCHWLTGS